MSLQVPNQFQQMLNILRVEIFDKNNRFPLDC